jgi:peptide/nickel transport system substrate-binding protein
MTFSQALASVAMLMTLTGVAVAQTPQRGGNLIYGVDAEPPTYDCQGTTTFVEMQTVGTHYSRLLKFDPDKYPGFKPDLAESWTESPDKLTYTFKLRSGVKFHDGSTLTAEDVRATFERIRKPPQGIVSVRKAQFEDISSIEAPDANTIVFKLSAPNSSIMLTLASPWNCVYSAAKLKEDPRWPETHIMGSGPYRFVEHIRGSHWVGTRFENYFEPGKPYLDGYRAVFIKGAAMINALQGGQIMAEFRGLTPGQRDRLKATASDKLEFAEVPWTCKLDVFFNAEKKPYDDPRVRHALSLAIDRWKGAEGLSKATFVKAVGASLRPGSEFAISDADLKRFPGFGTDGAAAKAQARKLLKEAGAEGLKFKLTTRTVPDPFSPVAVYLINEWKQIGVTAENTPLDVAQQKAAYLNGNYEVGLDANCYDIEEPNSQLLLYTSFDKSPINSSRYIDRTLDELFDKQKRAASPDERKRYIREFEARLFEQGWTAPIVWWERIVGHTKNLKGWKLLPSHYLNQDLADVWLAQN